MIKHGHSTALDLVIIIVSWNVRELLRRCLVAVERSLAGSGRHYAVIVVDNASHDGSARMLRDEFPQVALIECGSNLGFAGGNNVALRQVLAGKPAAPYCLLLNPDTEPQGDALAQLLATMEARPDLVVCGPQLRYPDGSVQSSRRRMPTRASFFWESTPLEQLWPHNPWVRAYRCEERPDDAMQEVGWLVGAALLVRTAAIQKAGLLDERFFMYSEELEWQHRLGRVGAVVYAPVARIVHYEGKSSEQAVAARYINFQRSKLLLARMMYGWYFAALLRAFLLVIYRYEIVIESGKLLLGHRRALRQQRIGVYQIVLRQLHADALFYTWR
ncbi:glycosyltransferase family 2 protein [Candidatus Gracilibacteria bacterium]|nr:glycosyltransferase family 2 protein [Candidatus Gracilibacteria bacterium]